MKLNLGSIWGIYFFASLLAWAKFKLGRLLPTPYKVFLSGGRAGYITLWRIQLWAVLSPPEHTSSSRWTGGTARAGRGLRNRSPGWRRPARRCAERRSERSASPGHRREPYLEPEGTDSRLRRLETEQRHEEEQRGRSKMKTKSVFTALFQVKITVYQTVTYPHTVFLRHNPILETPPVFTSTSI